MPVASSPTRSKNKLNILEFGDVHLGHHKTKTPHILQFLYSLLPNTKATRELDLIIIAGDLFDRLLYGNDPYEGDILIWMCWLLKKCEEYDIVLRVLEGTPSHDRNQPKKFVDLQKGLECNVDLKYVDDLEYEFIDKLGISVLYLPDEWNSDLLYCFEAAKLKLAEHGQTQADVVIMHGAFEYQYPAHIAEHAHSSELWQTLVKWFIFVGHVHQSSQHGKILAAGSVDRLCHGDEGAKGCLRVVLSFDGKHEITFIENKFAKVYKTIDCRGLETDTAIEAIRKVATNVEEGSYLRVKALNTDNVASGDVYFRTEFPMHYWDFDIENKDLERLKSEAVSFDDSFVPIDLTSKSLPALLKQRLVNRGYPQEQIDRVMNKYAESV